jgi:hypothetical protein
MMLTRLVVDPLSSSVCRHGHLASVVPPLWLIVLPPLDHSCCLLDRLLLLPILSSALALYFRRVFSITSHHLARSKNKMKSILLLFAASAFLLSSLVDGFSARLLSRRPVAARYYDSSTTIEAPTREDQRTSSDPSQKSYDSNDDELIRDAITYDDLEYLIDSQESRELDDPFHILLLGSTFDKPKLTVSYVAGSLEYVLNMPSTEATELAAFAQEHGMACLGTWERQECLSLGRQLQVRDIVCRVVPFVEGGQRGWQAKDAASAASGEQVGRGAAESY